MIYEHMMPSAVSEVLLTRNNVFPLHPFMFMLLLESYVGNNNNKKTLINHSTTALKGWLSVVVVENKKLKHQ